MTTNSTDMILWYDILVSGPDPKNDDILEIAVVLTDMDLQEIDHFQAVIRPFKCDQLFKNGSWYVAGLSREFQQRIRDTDIVYELDHAEMADDVIDQLSKWLAMVNPNDSIRHLGGYGLATIGDFLWERLGGIGFLLLPKSYDMLRVGEFMLAEYDHYYTGHTAIRALDCARQAIRDMQDIRQWFKRNLLTPDPH